MSDRVRKTFDDPYGKHALVMPDSEVDPLFGMVDVLSILEKNGGRHLHPSRVAPEYAPTHTKTCDRCDGDWGADVTCARCTLADGRPRPVGSPGPLRSGLAE